MAMRSVAAAARRLTVTRLSESARAVTATRTFSDDIGKIIHEEGLAADKMLIQKLEDKLEKLRLKAKKEKAEKEKQAGDKKA